MNLLSANDFKTLKNAMLRHEEIFISRQLGDVSATAKTRCVDYPWLRPMIVQIQMGKGHLCWIQNFENVEDAEGQMEEWNKRFHWI